MSKHTPTVIDPDIERIACDLLDHYGQRAIEVARERVTKLSLSPDRPALDVALRVLSAVAMILEEATNSEEVTRTH